MAEDNNNQVTPEAIAELKTQIDNLNQGIATYRDETKSSKEEIKSLKETNESLSKDFNDLKTSLENPEDNEEKEIVLNPEDEKKLESWAKNKGFVSKDELAVEKQKINLEAIKSYENQAVGEFLEKHPEYDTDENWQKILSEFSMYRQPVSVDGYRKLLNKIHDGLSGNVTKARQDGKTQVKIEEHNKGRLSLGGGNQSSGNENNQDIDNLQKRYPNLSREQIEDRLSEIGSLYTKK